MLNRKALTSVVVAFATTITTQSFAQDRGTGATPAGGAKAGAIQRTFTTSDAIPWKPVDPKHPGLMMFVVWGNPNDGASEILQKFPAGMDSGWHWHTPAYQGVVIQGKFTHIFKGAASRQACRDRCGRNLRDRSNDDKCEEGGDCTVVVYFHGKLDFIPVPVKAQWEREDYDYQPACDVDSSARDHVFRRTEALGQFASCRGDVGARSRTLSSTARCYGNCIRGAVCRASHDETRLYSCVLLLRRCDRDRAVARRFEGQSFCPDRTALDRRFHSGSLDFLLIRN
jgi:hypothetical protein